jgi:lysophospholipase L1-like esterase
MIKQILLGLAILLVVFLVFQTIRTRHYISTGRSLADAAEETKVSKDPKNSSMSILMIGDSTVVGTGADTPPGSLAGLVSKKFPKARLVNLGVNGRRTSELIPTLRDHPEKYDLIMVHTGGNDVVRFTDYIALETDLGTVLDLAKNRSDKIVLVASGNVGTALLLPFGSRWIFDKRTRAIRDIFIKVAKKKKILYVDLFREPDVDPFYSQPEIYYAADQFHPSSIGYSLWFERIEKGLDTTLK